MALAPGRDCFPPPTRGTCPASALSLILARHISIPFPTADTMSQISATTSSRLNYQSIFDNALEVYRKKTGKDLRSHPLLSKLETCDSPDAVLNTLRHEIPGFGQSGSSNDNNKLTKWLDPTTKVLFAFSSTIGDGVSLVSTALASKPNSELGWLTSRICTLKAYPPAGVIFSGIGILLSVSVLLEPRSQGPPLPIIVAPN